MQCREAYFDGFYVFQSKKEAGKRSLFTGFYVRTERICGKAKRGANCQRDVSSREERKMEKPRWHGADGSKSIHIWQLSEGSRCCAAVRT
jgi:hypothetical protein